MWRFNGISRGVFRALQKAGQITSECMVKTEEEDGIWFSAWLQGGTDREKHVYADALAEMLAPADKPAVSSVPWRQQRTAKSFLRTGGVCWNEEKADLFQRENDSLYRKVPLVYTRNPEGRKVRAPCKARALQTGMSAVWTERGK